MYSKGRGHHCWWLKKDGKGIAHFDEESDVDLIIELERSANEKIKSLDAEICEEIENRDAWEEKATNLAFAVGEYFGESVGEHSSANCPIRNAHELLNQI